MLKWLRMLNPRTAIETQDQAERAARVGAIGIFLFAGWSVVEAFQILLMADQMSAAWAAVMTPAEREAVGTAMSFLPYITAVATALLAMVCMVVGLVQWRTMTSLIPLLFLLWVAASLVMSLTDAVGDERAAAIQAMIPVWRIALNALVSLLLAAMFLTGFRGGSRLAQLGRQAETRAA